MLIHTPFTPTRESARVLLAMLERPTTIYQELASALLCDFGLLEMQKEIAYRLALQHAKRSPNIRHEVEASDVEVRYENGRVHCVLDEKKVLARLTRWLLNEQAKEDRQPDAFLRETIADLAASKHWAKGETAVVELQAGLVIRLDPPGGFVNVRGCRIPNYRISVTWSPEDQLYVARVPDLPGCTAHGETEEVARAAAREAIDLYVEDLLKAGELMPGAKSGGCGPTPSPNESNAS